MCVPNKHVAMRVGRYLPHKELVGATCSVELATCIDLHSAGPINPHTAMHTCMASHYSIFLFNLGSFFTSAVFVYTEKRGPKNRIVPKNDVPVFPSQDFVTTSKKEAVVRTLSFFSYTRKTGTQKTGRSFQRCPRRQRYLFVASRRAGPTRTKILKRDNTTTNSRFMIDLVAEMLFGKTAWCFCAARMLVKNGPKILVLENPYGFSGTSACK